MVQFKLIQNKQAVSNKMKKLRELVEGAEEEFLELMAQNVVLNSPVDTGTYINSHEIGAGRRRGGGTTSSRGKPRNQPYGTEAQQAINSLYADIQALPKDHDFVTIRNVAEHASEVEYDHGYAPYTQARREAPRLARQAAQMARAKVK